MGSFGSTTSFTRCKYSWQSYRDSVTHVPTTNSSAPLLSGDEGKKLQKQVWSEIIQVLKKDVPGVNDALQGLGSGRV